MSIIPSMVQIQVPEGPREKLTVLMKICATTRKPPRRHGRPKRGPQRKRSPYSDSDTYDPSGRDDPNVLAILDAFGEGKVGTIRLNYATKQDCLASIALIKRDGTPMPKLYAKACEWAHWIGMTEALEQMCAEPNSISCEL